MKNMLKLFVIIWMQFISIPLPAQVNTKTYFDQKFEYYFVSNNYNKALQIIDTLDQLYDLRTVNLGKALRIATLYKRKDLCENLLVEYSRNFIFEKNINSTIVGLKEFLKDSTFSFEHLFGNEWPTLQQAFIESNMELNNYLRSDYCNTLNNFFAVDQFCRFHDLPKSVFITVDSINLEEFCGWLIDSEIKPEFANRLNRQTLSVLLRHIGSTRFDRLEKTGIFSRLIQYEYITIEDYCLCYDYLHPNPVYYPAYDAFLTRSWEDSGIKTKAQLEALNQQRGSVGLLPVEFSAFCIEKGVIVPDSLKSKSLKE